MRQIEFRALDSTGTWNFGYFMKDFEGIAYITTLDGVNTSTVQEKTLGQFTGLKDKNGIKIYEGDVVRRFDENKIVSFIDENSCGCCNYGSGYIWSKYEAKSVEIVGNIHQNPELI